MKHPDLLFAIPNKSRSREPILEVQLGMERLSKRTNVTANRPGLWRLGKPCNDPSGSDKP